MPGGRLIAAAAAALAVSAPATAAAAPTPSVLVTAAPADAAALGAAARPALPAASLARLERRAGRPLPELRRVYRVDASGAADARRTARRLDARPGVEAVVDAPPPPPAVCRVPPPGGWPVLNPGTVTPDLAPFQDYQAGLGIPDSASGVGVRVADVEYEWRRTHEELGGRGLPAPVVTPGGLGSFKAEEHGTAVLGILGADDDGSGITGLAHASEIQPRSPFQATSPEVYDLLGTTLAAALALRPGDVLLIEQQTQVGASPSTVFAPVEAIPAMRDLIRAIVDSGVVVVEPAGNGDRDLASFNLPWLADPADPGNSGALLVGAGDSPTTGTDLARAAGTNYGARLDVQGYGAGVLTAGYGEGIGTPEPKDRAYTSCFDGTSSASATVAGAVAALQGLARAAHGAPLAPEVVRAALVATGLPQPDPLDTPIGPRPQVSAAATLVGAAAPPAGSEAPPGPAAAAPPPVAARSPRAAAPAARPAARAAGVRLDRRAGTLTITLRGLAPRAVVFAGGRRVRVVRDRVVLTVIRPRRFLLVVSAPSARGRAYAVAGFRVVVPARGPARIARL